MAVVGGPHEAAASPDGRTVVVTNYNKQGAGQQKTLSVIALPSGDTIKTIDLGEYRAPHDVRWIDDTHVVTTAEGSQALLVVNITTGQVERTFKTELAVSHMLALSTDRTRIYCSNMRDGSVSAFDFKTGQKIKDVKTGKECEGVGVTPDGRWVWAGNRAEDTISVIDTKSLEVVKHIPSKGFPYRVQFTPDGNLIYHDPDLAPSHHYLAAYRWLGAAQTGLRCARRRPPRQARLDGVAARQERRALGRLRDRRRDRQPAADLPVPGQRPRRGRAGQAPRARHDHRPPDPADGARRVVRRHRAPGAAARRARQHRRDGPGQAARRPRRDLAADARRRDAPRPGSGRATRATRSSTTSSCTSTAGSARSRTPRSATDCTSSARRRRARPGSTWCSRSCVRPRCGAVRPLPCRGCEPPSGSRTAEATTAVDAIETQARELVQRMEDVARGPRRRPTRCTTTRRCSGCCASPPSRWCLDCARTTDELGRTAARARRGVRAGRAVGLAAARAGQRAADRAQLLHRRPAGRAVAAGLGDRSGDGDLAAGAAPRRHRRLPDVGRAVDLGHLARCARRETTSPRCSRCSAYARSGTRRRVGSATWSSCRSTELGRPRIDVTVRISGFFRDAFPHVVTMLDDAVRLVADLGRARRHQLRAGAHARPTWPSTATSAGRRRGSSAASPGRTAPASCRPIESGSWRDDADLAEVYTAWGGFAYGRDLDGAPAADDMRANYRRIKVAAKNIDTREHDIADSDDYFQYHGGMIATVRALTGAAPAGVRRGLDHARRRTHPDAPGGDQPGLPGPGGQPALDLGDAATRLQGRVRAGGDGRLPLRLRRDRRRRARLDVRVAGAGVRARRDQPRRS